MLSILIPDKNGNGGFYRYIGNVNVGLKDFPQPGISPYLVNIQYRIEALNDRTGDNIEISGWAFIKGQDSYYGRIEIILKSGNRIYESPADLVLRPDVTGYFNSLQKFDMSGFTSLFTRAGLEKGEYEVGIRVINDRLHIEGVEYTARPL